MTARSVKATVINPSSSEQAHFTVDDDGDNDPISEDIRAEFEKIQRVFNESPDDTLWNIRIYRHVRGLKKPQFVCNCQPWELEGNMESADIMTRLQETYGGGEFTAWIYRKDGGEKEKLFKKITDISVAKPLAKAEANPHRPRGDMSEGMAALIAQQQNFFKEIFDRMSRPEPAQQIDPLGQLDKLAGVIQKLVPAAPAQAAGGFNADAMLNFIGGVMKLTGDGDRGERGETNIYDVIKGFLDPEIMGPIARTLMTMPAALPAPAAPPAAGRAPTPATGAPKMSPADAPKQPQQPSQIDMIKAQWKQYVPQLMNHAAMGTPIEAVGDYILNNMTPAQLDALLSVPDLEQWLLAEAPQIQAHWQWFLNLLSYIRGDDQQGQPDNVQEQTEFSSGVTAGAGGNQGNFKNYVGAGDDGGDVAGNPELGGQADV